MCWPNWVSSSNSRRKWWMQPTLRGRLVSSTAVSNSSIKGRYRRQRVCWNGYALEGDVISGTRHRVQTCKMPTLNLATNSEVLPAPGVYITRTRPGRLGRA
ncbi:MAG: riboflavin kinase [Bryobacteraceae bacterium]